MRTTLATWFDGCAATRNCSSASSMFRECKLSSLYPRRPGKLTARSFVQEKTYNPYYTLVAHRMASQSHSFQITLQYCLWDFLRELGEKTVGGEELVKTITDDGVVAKVSKRRIVNLAKLYAWCVAKDVLNLTIFKVRLLSLFPGISRRSTDPFVFPTTSRYLSAVPVPKRSSSSNNSSPPSSFQRNPSRQP